MEERNIRIPINLDNSDTNVTLKIEQEFDNLEVLSLKISNTDAYSRMCSDFGVIVGRVMLNSGFGVQNAKVNIFIPITEEDRNRPEIYELYPFETVNDTYPNGVRYNLLPRVRNTKNPSHRSVGNFPHESDFAHYPQLLEITEKYYKYTTTTNESGDYMIFGVPLGQRDIVMDFDVFDTASFDITANDLVEQVSLNGSISALEELLAQSADPALNSITGSTQNRDKVPGFIYRGNNNYDVEIKTNLDEMVNIFHQVKQVVVSPFWGDDDFCDVGITRCDFKINFKYTPTAIFFGFIHSSNSKYSIDKNYNYTDNYNFGNPQIYTEQFGGDILPLQKMEIVVYRLDENLNPGSRKRLGVFPASFYNGIFRISLPMYDDYYITNEFGDLVPTNDKENGIPTKGYYAFEIYDTDDAWTNRRSPKGGFDLRILPGVRIPSTSTGDVWLGGWDGTWTGLFEYDIINRKRKFYTVKTIHTKHDYNNIKKSGEYVRYFPSFSTDKQDAFWNFPINVEDTPSIEEPTIIGSILIPRVKIEPANENGGIYSPHEILSTYWLSPDSTYNVLVQDCEVFLGLGVKKSGGKNKGSVFTDLFSGDEFIYTDGVNAGRNVFGDVDTWNYGDNSEISFTPTLYSVEKSKEKDSNANAFGVHKAYNQVVTPITTYGVFINSLDSTITNKRSVMEILIYDITDELPGLIKDGVYSSYRKGIGSLPTTFSSINELVLNTVNNTDSTNIDVILDGSTGLNIVPIASTDSIALTIDNQNTEIYIEDDGVVTDQTGNIITSTININSYNNKFYYFGLWKESNALYDIEKNYFVR